MMDYTNFIGTVTVNGESNEYGLDKGTYLVFLDRLPSHVCGTINLLSYTDHIVILAVSREKDSTAVLFRVDGRKFTAEWNRYPWGVHTWYLPYMPEWFEWITVHGEARHGPMYDPIKRDKTPLGLTSEYDEATKAGIVLDAPCGCYCCTVSVQMDHGTFCSVPETEIVEAEDRGEVFRSFVNGRMTWKRWVKERP